MPTRTLIPRTGPYTKQDSRSLFTHSGRLYLPLYTSLFFNPFLYSSITGGRSTVNFGRCVWCVAIVAFYDFCTHQTYVILSGYRLDHFFRAPLSYLALRSFSSMFRQRLICILVLSFLFIETKHTIYRTFYKVCAASRSPNNG